MTITATAQFVLQLRKTTANNLLCYDEPAGRIGRLYIHPGFADRLGLEKEIILQLSPDKTNLKPGGYQTRLFPVKTTSQKIKFIECYDEAGEIGDLYISKVVLEHLGYNLKTLAQQLAVEDPAAQRSIIAARIAAAATETAAATGASMPEQTEKSTGLKLPEPGAVGGTAIAAAT
ncbi:hypothetical protein [Desulfurispora thermophila]|uniref:hypothetical protein n=1 Tax=Desulfurispora thermophila TaxID=265470 RepID=UPI00036CC24B|nr:hypothetical protein [Desulfurispora thermophila]